jgi:general secretion pathway protein I
MKRSNISRFSHGFTLIEVLIALAILAIALAATMRATGLATNTAADVKMRTYATWVAQNRIAELTATRAFPSAGTNNGQATMAGVNFEWKQEANDTPNPNFRKVDVTVSLPGESSYLVKMTGYLTRAPNTTNVGGTPP